MMKQQTKKFWKSKTLWVNFLLVFGGVCTAVGGELAAGGTITGIGLLGILLRILTNAQIEM